MQNIITEFIYNHTFTVHAHMFCFDVVDNGYVATCGDFGGKSVEGLK